MIVILPWMQKISTCLNLTRPELTQGCCNAHVQWLGRIGAVDIAAYCASKSAIEGTSQALAQELPASVVCIAPNPNIIENDMLYICFGDSASDAPGSDDWQSAPCPIC